MPAHTHSESLANGKKKQKIWPESLVRQLSRCRQVKQIQKQFKTHFFCPLLPVLSTDSLGSSLRSFASFFHHRRCRHTFFPHFTCARCCFFLRNRRSVIRCGSDGFPDLRRLLAAGRAIHHKNRPSPRSLSLSIGSPELESFPRFFSEPERSRFSQHVQRFAIKITSEW